MDESEMPHNVTFVGAGSWGTALAVHAARLGHRVRLYGRDAARMAAMAKDRVSHGYLDGVTLPPNLTPVASLAEAIGHSRGQPQRELVPNGVGLTDDDTDAFVPDLIVLAVPSRGFSDSLDELAQAQAWPAPRSSASASGPAATSTQKTGSWSGEGFSRRHAGAVSSAADRPRAPIVWATKGLAPRSGAFLHEVFAERFGDWPSGVLSGPSFAADVAAGLPTAIVGASGDAAVLECLRAVFHGAAFRVYDNHDVLGVELGGALKNVLAIAAGVADGANLGANARAALITRGLAEMQRLGAALGARPETLVGLSGLGDLVLTCTDDQSRNRRLGLALGRGVSPEDAAREIGQAVEGLDTARVALARAEACGVDLPIVAEVEAVIAGRRTVGQAMVRLLEREPGPEV
ncbi:MAG: NAD(P)H-dependent glycerol-3-phosphate dehydrogenase [Thioalkalivibrionaceae bacterium]